MNPRSLRVSAKVPSFLALAGLCVAGGCYHGPDDLLDDAADAADAGERPGDPPIGNGLVLRVLDVDDRPIPGATVTLGCACPGGDDSACESRETAADGRTAGIPITTDRPMIACVEADRFAPVSAVLPLRAAAGLEHTVRLLPLVELTPELTADGYLVEHEGVRVLIPKDGVVDAARSAVGPDFTVTLAAIDPADRRRGLAASPGPLRADDGGPALLESFGMVDVTLRRGAERLQLAEGSRATLELPISPDHPSWSDIPTGASIPAWSYDLTAARWRREGDGTVVDRDGARVWVAQVGHFSWWNADIADTEKDCLLVHVKHQNQDADTVLVNIPVTAEGISYAGFFTGFTDMTGTACLEIPEGADVKIYVGTYDNKLFNSGEQVLLGGDGVNQGDQGDSQGCGGGGCLELPDPIEISGALCDPDDLFQQYSGPPGTLGVGICTAATYECQDGVWKYQMGVDQPPEAEIPDNLVDENCDGLVEEAVCTAEEDYPDTTCNLLDYGYRKLGECTGHHMHCNANNKYICVDPQNLPAVQPDVEDPNNLIDEDCDGWPTSGAAGMDYLLLGGPAAQSVTDAVRHGARFTFVGTNADLNNKLRIVAGHDDGPITTADVPGDGDLFIGQFDPNGSVVHKIDTMLTTPVTRPIVVAANASHIFVAGVCFDTTTLPGGAALECPSFEENALGLYGLWIARYDLDLQGPPLTAMFVQSSEVNALEDLTLAASTDTVTLGGTFRETLVLADALTTSGTGDADGFLMQLSAADLTPMNQQQAASLPAYAGSSQRITRVISTPAGFYVLGEARPSVRFDGAESESAGIFVARLDDAGLVDHVEVIRSATGNCSPEAIVRQDNTLLVGISDCGDIMPSSGTALDADDELDHGFVVRVHVELDASTPWTWEQADILTLPPRAEPRSLATTNDGVIVAGDFREVLESASYPTWPLEMDGASARGMFVGQYDFATGADPWTLPISADPSKPGARARHVSFVGGELTIVGTYPEQLHLDQKDPLLVPQSTETDSFILTVPEPTLN